MIFFAGAVAIACTIAKFDFEWRVLLILQARHKRIYESLRGSNVPYRLAKFAFFRSDRPLHDPELSRSAKELKWLNITLFTSLLCIVALLARR